MVGTEEGMIHTCSLKYNRNYVSSVQGHHMPVYRINYNYFNNSIYASCAGDWRVKIWEDGREYVNVIVYLLKILLLSFFFGKGEHKALSTSQVKIRLLRFSNLDVLM